MVIAPSDPGTIGSPESKANCLAETLFPIILITEAGGPTNSNPLFSTFSAKSGFSDKKPYPGWTPSEPDNSIALIIAGIFI